jgi:hypothetical protein
MYELLIANLTDMKEKREYDEQGSKALAAQLLSAKAIRYGCHSFFSSSPFHFFFIS